AYANAFEKNIAELNNWRLDEIIQTVSLPKFISNFSELFTDVVQDFSQSIEIIDNKGKKRLINSHVSQLTDSFNEINFAIQMLNDVTSYKDEEYEIINNERLKTLNYIANSFAHKFNNQLMEMYGNSYLLKSNLKDKKLATYANSLFTTISNTSKLTHNLLSFSKKGNKIKVITDIPDLIETLIDELSIPPTINIKTHFDRKNKSILGDPSHLKIALSNIIENAVGAISGAGEIVFETRLVYFESDSKNNTTNLNDGKYLKISIKDNGKGIQQNDIPKIFDPFFSTKSTDLNAGLGLTIALKTIEEHYGTIKVNSNSDGTDVMVYLPQQETDIINKSIIPDEQLIINGTANIVIIDDEDVVRIVTGELLKKLGYNVFSFSSGLKAIKFYKENIQDVDLVLLDKHMPQLDGSEVYKKLKNINPEIKVVLMTGFNIDSEILEIFQHKNNTIIQKPVSVEKLSKAISTLLHKK
nr:response regulator [Prolixibacteraceae bacterium]